MFESIKNVRSDYVWAQCAMAFRRSGTNVLMDGGHRLRINYGMRPLDIQQIGGELAIKWEDGSESFVPLEKLRRYCPCAGCKGEVDIMGNLYRGPEKALKPEAFQLVR